MGKHKSKESSTSTLASKRLHYAGLHAQLQELEKNILRLQENLKVTAEHVPAFRKLEILHSSMYVIKPKNRVWHSNC